MPSAATTIGANAGHHATTVNNRHHQPKISSSPSPTSKPTTQHKHPRLARRKWSPPFPSPLAREKKQTPSCCVDHRWSCLSYERRETEGRRIPPGLLLPSPTPRYLRPPSLSRDRTPHEEDEA
nr:hypothetical protein Iba_scaffold10073CG0050 [Ipomoea batatas]